MHDLLAFDIAMTSSVVVLAKPLFSPHGVHILLFIICLRGLRVHQFVNKSRKSELKNLKREPTSL